MSSFKKKVYNLVPSSIKNYLDILVRHRVMKEKTSEILDNYVELNPVHIQRTKLITDRETLLNLLPKDKVICEIGVDTGDFTQKILEKTTPRKLHLIDLWGSERYPEEKFNFVKKRFDTEINSELVQIHRGYSTKVLMDFPNSYFDWVYLDSGHGFELTVNELQLLNKKIKPDGIISGHDYCRFRSDGGSRFGVVEAVNKFCVEQNFEFLYLTMETHRHLSFAIRKI